MRLKGKYKLQQRRWLERQLNDPYVKKAQKEGYRSRAAYKLIEIQEKHKLFKAGQKIIDLGAAPGSWSQVLSHYRAEVLAIDLAAMEPLFRVQMIQSDFRNATEAMQSFGPVHGIISDISPSTTGLRQVDHLKMMGLLEDIIPLLQPLLLPQGFFVCKTFKGGLEADLFNLLKQQFAKVVHMKPPASRKESPEEYLVAKGKR